MKTALLTLSLTIPLSSMATTLPNYQAVSQSMRAGSNVRLTVDFSKCQPKLALFASYQPDSFMQTAQGIFFSAKHFTLNNPNYPSHAINEFVSYHLIPNGNLAIKTRWIDAKTLRPMPKQPAIVNCQLNKSTYFYSK